MKHFKQLTLIILCFSLLLSGCGSTGTSATNNSNDDNSSNTNMNTNEHLSIEKDEYSFSEYLSIGETIWYLTDGYGKDDKINQIFVVEPDGTLYYCYSDWTLGEAEQKDDAEIISYVKQTYEEDMTERINRWMRMTTLGDCEVLSDMTSLYSPYLENIEPAPYKLAIITDSTGNNTEKEVLAYQEFAPLHFEDNTWDIVAEITNIELSYISAYESDQGTVNSFQIYDSWYGGYIVRTITRYWYHVDYTDSSVQFFLTRLDSNKMFELDEVGTEDVGIDNVDSLFEDKGINIEYGEYLLDDIRGE